MRSNTYFIFFTLFGLSLLGSDCSGDFPESEIKTFINNTFDSHLNTDWEKGGEAMVVVGVFLEKNGSTELERCYFYSNASNPLPKYNTLFQIGSVTKVFTATIFERLNSIGVVKLDEPAQNYLPDVSSGLPFPVLPNSYKGDTKDITLGHLLSHNAGFLRNVDVDASTGTTPYLHAFVEIEGTSLEYLPGSNCYIYSSIGFGIAGLALSYQAYPGKSDYYNYYEQVLIGWLLGPLGMDDTRITLTSDQESRRANPYNASGKSSTYDLSSWPMNHAGGGLYSTIYDMMKFGKGMVGKEPSVISESEIADMLKERNRKYDKGCSPDRTDYAFFQGLGWQIRKDLYDSSGNSITRYKKGGGTNGFSAEISCSTPSFGKDSYRAFVIVLANKRGFPVKDSADILQEIFNLAGV